MKLYFDDLLFNIDFKFKYSQILLYSDEGIFYFKDNKLYKKNIEYNTYTYKFKNYEILIDNTIYNEIDEIYYSVPYNSIEVEESYFEHTINKNIKIIKKKYFNETECYFYIDNLNDIILNKIITFISKNNIKNNKYD